MIVTRWVFAPQKLVDRGCFQKTSCTRSFFRTCFLSLSERLWGKTFLSQFFVSFGKMFSKNFTVYLCSVWLTQRRKALSTASQKWKLWIVVKETGSFIPSEFCTSLFDSCLLPSFWGEQSPCLHSCSRLRISRVIGNFGILCWLWPPNVCLFFCSIAAREKGYYTVFTRVSPLSSLGLLCVKTTKRNRRESMWKR